MTRYLVGFLCVCALGVIPLVGCDATPRWRPGQCELLVYVDDLATYEDAPDGTDCTYFDGGPGVCVAGSCERRCAADTDCTDYKDCTTNACDTTTGLCSYTAAADGGPCAGGICQDGECMLTSSVLPCTAQGIRNAIAAGGGPYTFACDGPTRVVTEAEIVIDKDVVLDGQSNLIVDGGGSHRVFFVEIATAELNRLTVTGGSAYGVEWERRQGGGIYNIGFLTLTDCTVSGNTAEQYGGGIYNQWRGVAPDNSTLEIRDSTVSGNTAEYGGGISNAGVFTIANSMVSGNTASRNGGGIYNTHSSSVVDSTVMGNTAAEHGGGINGVGLTLVGSTVSGNAAELGAGAYFSGESTAVNSTISGNTASARGGGIFHDIYGELALIHSSVWDNAAPEGPGIFSDGKPEPGQTGAVNAPAPRSHPPPTGGGTVTVRNSLIQGDCHVEPPAEHISEGHNIESPGDTCGFDQTGDQVGVPDPMLGPLQNNGGPTMTHALEGTVGVDVIPEAECVDADGAPLATDQRGEPRDSMCDVGAFEVQP